MKESKTLEQLGVKNVVTGMLALFGSTRSFSADHLREFLREESKAFPLFRTLLTKNGSLFGDELSLFLEFSSVVRKTKFGSGDLVVSESGRQRELEMLGYDGTLPAHKEFLQGLATRFGQYLSGGQPVPKASEYDKRVARQLIESAQEAGELHRSGALHPSIRSDICNTCQGLIMTEDLVEEHMQAHKILGE